MTFTKLHMEILLNLKVELKYRKFRSRSPATTKVIEDLKEAGLLDYEEDEGTYTLLGCCMRDFTEEEKQQIALEEL